MANRDVKNANGRLSAKVCVGAGKCGCFFVFRRMLMDASILQ